MRLFFMGMRFKIDPEMGRLAATERTKRNPLVIPLVSMQMTI